MSFAFWTHHPYHPTVRLKEHCESWPVTLNEPCNEVSGFMRDYTMKWRDDPDFPDHPIRDKAGKIILPASLDQTPEEYVDANTPAAPVRTEEAVRYPFSGPANLVRGPGANRDTIAAYERSRRGLRKLVSKPPVPPYEPPTAPASSFTPKMGGEPGPDIAPRVYSRDKFDPKYQRPRSRE